jgi:carboxymethylenebutenolidase
MPETTYATPAGSLSGYLAVPDTQGPWPGVIVLHDIRGMTADVRRIADRFAAAGYLALAPGLYGRGVKIRCMIKTVRALLSGTGDAYADIVGARDHLLADPRCTGKVGLVGFCMGGGLCLQLTPRGLFDVTAPNYGQEPKDIDALTRSCPVVASYAKTDLIVGAGAADRLQAVLERGAVPHDVKEYAAAGHGFMNDFTFPVPFGWVETLLGLAGIAYSEPEAEDAWRRILAFFGEYLKC